jgi:UDP-glucose 4-epimerase
VRDRRAVLSLFSNARPNILYHLAAQHDPGLGESEVHRTISTNVTGTLNVVDACRTLSGVRLAFASTGKVGGHSVAMSTLPPKR